MIGFPILREEKPLVSLLYVICFGKSKLLIPKVKWNEVELNLRVVLSAYFWVSIGGAKAPPWTQKSDKTEMEMESPSHGLYFELLSLVVQNM